MCTVRRWPFGDIACRLMHYLINVTAYVTVYTLRHSLRHCNVTVYVTGYVAVKSPLRQWLRHRLHSTSQSISLSTSLLTSFLRHYYVTVYVTGYAIVRHSLPVRHYCVTGYASLVMSPSTSLLRHGIRHRVHAGAHLRHPIRDSRPRGQHGPLSHDRASCRHDRHHLAAGAGFQHARLDPIRRQRHVSWLRHLQRAGRQTTLRHFLHVRLCRSADRHRRLLRRYLTSHPTSPPVIREQPGMSRTSTRQSPHQGLRPRRLRTGHA